MRPSSLGIDAALRPSISRRSLQPQSLMTVEFTVCGKQQRLTDAVFAHAETIIRCSTFVAAERRVSPSWSPSAFTRHQTWTVLFLRGTGTKREQDKSAVYVSRNRYRPSELAGTGPKHMNRIHSSRLQAASIRCCTICIHKTIGRRLPAFSQSQSARIWDTLTCFQTLRFVLSSSHICMIR